MPTKPKGKIPPNTTLKDGVFFNNQGDTIRNYIPSEERFINEPISAYRPRARSSVFEQARRGNIEGGLVEALPVQIPMRQQYALTKDQGQKPFDPMTPYSPELPEHGMGGSIAGGAASGAATGMALGPWAAAAGAVIGGVGGWLKGRKENEALDAEQELIDEQELAQKEKTQFADRQTRFSNIVDDNQTFYGATFENGGLIEQGFVGQPQIIDYSNGEKHGESPINGIPVDARGNPATTSKSSAVGLTEKGEVTWNGYVFSDKLKTK